MGAVGTQPFNHVLMRHRKFRMGESIVKKVGEYQENFQ